MGELGIVGKICQAVHSIVGALHKVSCCIGNARSHVPSSWATLRCSWCFFLNSRRPASKELFLTLFTCGDQKHSACLLGKILFMHCVPMACSKCYPRVAQSPIRKDDPNTAICTSPKRGNLIAGPNINHVVVVFWHVYINLHREAGFCPDSCFRGDCRCICYGTRRSFTFCTPALVSLHSSTGCVYPGVDPE